MRLREKYIVYNVPMQNTFLYKRDLNFKFPSNVKKITGFLISANRTGAGTPKVFSTTMLLNSEKEEIFSGDVLVEDMANFDGQFKFKEIDVDVIPNSLLSGVAIHFNCASVYTAKYYFRCIEQVDDNMVTDTIDINPRFFHV